MLTQRVVLMLVVHVMLNSFGNALFEFPSFNWIKQLKADKEPKANKLTASPKSYSKGESEKVRFVTNEPEDENFRSQHQKHQEVKKFNFEPSHEHQKGQEVEEINFGFKPDYPKGQEQEEFHFGPKHEDHKGQEVEEINFGSKPHHSEGQEQEEFHFGTTQEDHIGQEVEEINFGSKPHHPKGQEVEEVNFDSKPHHSKGQEQEEFYFGPPHEDHKEQEVEEINFGSKPHHSEGQEQEEFHFGTTQEDNKGQEVEEINIGSKPHHPKGQEQEEFHFGPPHEDHKGQEVEEINFGSKPHHPKGQEVEEVDFGSKPDHSKGQEQDEFHFGPPHEDHKGQEVEEINFGSQPHHSKGQEVEEINFGFKPDHPKGQKQDEFHFGTTQEDHKGQEVEEINFGSKPHHPKGQEVEEVDFGSKPDHPKGQEVEEVNFGSKPHHPKGQEQEEFHFGPTHEDHKKQEVEEINFGSNPHHPKGQEVEEVNFGSKPHHPKGQEQEEFHFGTTQEDHKGQEVEEINIGSKPHHPKGQEQEEFHFGPPHEDHKGREVEEINFGSKPHHPKGQEVEEVDFGSKPDHSKGQEQEEFHFGPTHEDHKGQEVEEINFGFQPDHSEGQEVEEINFGSKPHHPKGQEQEEFHFEQAHEDHKGQEVEEINFGFKPHHPKVQEQEDLHFGPTHEDHKGQEVEEVNFGSKPHHPKGQDQEEFHFGSKHEDHKEQETVEINGDLNTNSTKSERPSDVSSWLGSLTHESITGCYENFEIPENSISIYKTDKLREISCKPGYQFSGSYEKIELECDDNNWVSSVGIIPECHPVCEPPCQNDGICVATNQCSCQKNFEGAQCQFRYKPCLNQPPVSHNSYVNCNSSNCIVKCFDNYLFPDGSSEEHLVCHHGQWSLTRKDWSFLPDCKPSCQPPCINGGSCLDFNKCHCPREYVGPQCQYELSACDAKKLNFNGYYTCRGENDKVSCTLSCPEGYESVTPLAKEYVCHYSEGKFFPETVPKCKYDKNTEIIQFASSSHTVHGGPESFETNQVPFNTIPVSTAECLTWGRHHYKNFDGKLFSFEGVCSYVLVEDTVDNSFRIIIENTICENCPRSLKIFYQGQEYRLHYNDRTPVITVNDVEFPIPSQFIEFLVEKAHDQILVFLQSIDVALNWSGEDRLSVVINKNMWNKTGGLCGNFNNNPNDDFLTPDASTAWDMEIFVRSWAENPYECESVTKIENNCTDDSAKEYCKKIFTDVHFEECYNAGILKPYQEACVWDMCRCGKSCACETVHESVKACRSYFTNKRTPDLFSDWRQIAGCPLECPPGKVYSACGPSSKKTCGSFGMGDVSIKYSECVEGCFCPEGLFEFNDTCVQKEYCPCRWTNKYYNNGEKIKKNCNTCTCQNGEWKCTTLKCFARCSVTGSSHYVTFDGKRYDFEGQCGYYLLKSENYSIQAENQPCEEDFLNGIFHSYFSKRLFCSKLITIKHNTDKVKLKRNREVLVNGVEITSFPAELNGVTVRLVSHFVIVKLWDNTEIWWDGNRNIYIDSPGNALQPTRGLCGTANDNQKDDFTTLEGDIEQTVSSFVEKWKVDESCNELINHQKLHPCDLDVTFKEIAEKYCQKLKGKAFEACHSYVDVEPYYENCLYDLCSCQKEIKQCFCPVLADYATECTRHNIKLPWRNEIRECGLHCSQEQVYHPCGDSCARSCRDIAIVKGHCEKKCAEGCGCPDGLVLNSKGKCILVSECHCFHQNVKYKPNSELLMESDSGPLFCTCQDASWSCRPATKLEIARDYENSDQKCSDTLHEEYTSCKPAEPKTCKNMHEKPEYSTRICFPGCVCKKGFVWDSIGKLCVNASECPCHHGGRSYADGEKIQQDCNTCICKNGMWSCTERECSSTCSTWGDAHFRTFDGKIYDFQGSCDFVFASGELSEYETFFISIQIVPCGSTGISCPKSVALTVGSPTQEEKVVFKKSEKFIPKSLTRILIREVGLFIYAEVFDLGITVQWDRGTRVYVKADSRWKNKVKGLCGNFNDNELDDFKTPSSGETSEISPVLFADSWRMQSYCPESNHITDTCARRPHRKAWASQKCSILNSEIFEPCHSEVPFQPYLERCETDSCGCDEGGDCECMCTAIAAYAEECTLRGVPIKWRTQQICPLQCEDNSKYSPCISSCPAKSCDNQFRHSALLQTCSEESCVEGCQRHRCPPGHVLADSSSNRCIPIASCKTVCLTLNNVTYLEGDLMESDDCHSCYCSRHVKVCTGEPCAEVTSTSVSPTPTSVCPKNQTWDDCIVKCDHVCNYLMEKLSSELQCFNGDDCVSGCRPIDLKCSPGMFLRDKHTCVHKKDCPCASSSGSSVKPGDVMYESSCEKCQCINNEYECINVCSMAPPMVTTQSSYNYTRKRYTVTPGWDFSQEGNVTLIFHTTVTPKVLCPHKIYESVVDKFTRFSASSHLDESSLPVFGQMSSKGIWIAGANDADQYIQVDLGRVELIFAVNVAGSSRSYVTGYNLLYSIKGDKFFNIFNHEGKKEVFGGPFNGYQSVKQMLPIPIEARYIRFHPTSWHVQIAMKVDVLGCKDLVTPTTPHLTTFVPSICNTPIGIGQKYYPKLQISATSSKPNNGPQFIGFDNEKGWRPLTNSKSEFVQLDFGEYANITGVITKGVSHSIKSSPFKEEAWVERYKVEYSHDGLTWNPVLDDFGDEVIFMGNTNSETEKKNFFNRPVHAKVLKIKPVKWHENIALRLDVMGCYEPSSLQEEVIPSPTLPTTACNVCPGVLIDKEHCHCTVDEWWNGENCISHSECPCFVGLIAYPVGTTFTTEKCEECVCRLYGLPHCTPKVCQDCAEGLQKVLTPLCGCICKPCEENTRLCPTSNICINESAWCDGVQDCPDDELNCTSITKVPPTLTPCVTSCPSGYEVVFRNKTAGPTEAEGMLYVEKVKSVKSKKSVKTYRKSKKVKKSQKLTQCPPYDCVPVKEIEEIVCPFPECPMDYKVVYEKHFESAEGKCPEYACEPVVEFANCTVLSKHIKTFDGMEYKPEICDHVLVTHDSGLWNVSIIENCTYMSPCTTTLVVNHGDHTVELYLHNYLVKVDSFICSDDQVELLNSKQTDFTLNPIGNSFIFKSNIYDFEIVYGLNGNFKIQVPSYMKGHLAGLCGLYNGHPKDDKTRPDGELSKTFVDFTESWLNPGAKECIESVCPIETQNLAFEICLILKKKPFNSCTEDVNLELCIESACDCLTRNETADECRCQVLSDFASKCKSTDLFGWRIEHNCPTLCTPNLVYYDCYPYACQPTCGNEECTEPAVNCYSGCFCPDGLVKRGDQCIKPLECRDCVCSGVGDSTYLTFDGALSFNGNCTYLATREKNPTGVPSFEVFIKNTLCKDSDFMTCTSEVEVKVPGNSIKILAISDTEEMVRVLVNGQVENLLSGEKLDKIWSKINLNPESFSVHVELPWEHVDVRYFYKRLAFTISLPSHYYHEKVEGLCGSCSRKVIEPEDIDNPEIWQVEKDHSCIIEPPASCTPTPDHRKMCLFMNDTKIFGQCLVFVDPTPFIDQCLTLACVNGHLCSSLEAYGQACRDAGVCVDWRSDVFCPFTCSSDLEYQPCNNGCQKTCDNYNEVHPACEYSFIEGCFCPDNQVLINGTCKPEKYCEYCDVEGHHFENESWQVDKCTSCTCSNHMVTCKTTKCPEVDIICEEDHVVLKEENDFDCCPKFACVCKRRDECKEVEMPNDLMPGLEAIVNETGCCPRVEVVCQPDKCPKPEPCKQYYVQKKINTTNCCPEYFCEKPNDKCIYEFGATPSTTKNRTKRGLTKEIVKEVGERWSDGPCKSCVCMEKEDGLAEAVCTISECLNLKDHTDFNDYELEEVHNAEKCCPEIIRKACKHNGHLYIVGDTWVPDDRNPCETLKCNNWGDQIVKETRLEVCNQNCEPGWEYKNEEGACCGHCVQAGCFAEDKIYKEGEFWFSKDNCSKSTCTVNHGRFTITTEMKTCPSIEDCPKEDIYQDECCLRCETRPKSKVICSPQLLPPGLTVDVVRVRKGKHGKCHNNHPIKNFTQCAGNCHSFTIFKSDTWSHVSVCECCKPQQYAEITVDLVCSDGLRMQERVKVPSECACTPCS